VYGKETECIYGFVGLLHSFRIKMKYKTPHKSMVRVKTPYVLFPKVQYHYKGGETIRVIAGLFKGVEGKVARFWDQQCAFVTLTNVGLISTAYIPIAFIKN